MSQQAISVRPRIRAAAVSPALREALAVFGLSRLVVWGSAMLAVYLLPVQRFQERAHDVPSLSGALGRALGSLAHWDSVWYLSIAQSGYGGRPSLSAFFPLYPVAVRAAAFNTLSSGALLIAGYAVSAAAFVAALVLLHRLVELELGARFARPVLWLVA